MGTDASVLGFPARRTLALGLLALLLHLVIFLPSSPPSSVFPRCRCDSENRYLGNPLRGTCYCE